MGKNSNLDFSVYETNKSFVIKSLERFFFYLYK